MQSTGRKSGRAAALQDASRPTEAQEIPNVLECASPLALLYRARHTTSVCADSMPIALTIAGSDSSGGAGIQADLKTFAALGVHGTSAITCITAQNPHRISAIQSCPPEMVRKQIAAVFSELHPAACKTGMLFSAAIVDIVADWFAKPNRPPLVVDPVMIATSKARLMEPSALRQMKKRLLPLATLITPNVSEVEVFLRIRLRSEKDLRKAAMQLYENVGCAALVKGGHLPAAKEAVDWFFDGKQELRLAAPFLKRGPLHGTGCTYSAAITALLAKGEPLSKAVQLAKDFITRAIAQSEFAGKYPVLSLQF